MLEGGLEGLGTLGTAMWKTTNFQLVKLWIICARLCGNVGFAGFFASYVMEAGLDLVGSILVVAGLERG